MSITLKDNILSEEDINYILSLPQIINAKKELDSKSSGHVYFLVNLPLSIKNKTYEKLGLKLDFINMRWVKGDQYPHIDTSVQKIKKTKLTDNHDELIIENEHYPIMKGLVPNSQGNLIEYIVGFNFTEELLEKFSGSKSTTKDEEQENLLIIESLNYPENDLTIIRQAINKPYLLSKIKHYKNTLVHVQKKKNYFSLQNVYFNKKSSFCGTTPISSNAVGIGAIRGKGSSTRIFNNCKRYKF